MVLEVHCYSGHKGEERPVRFRIHERVYDVEDVLDQWYGPEQAWYKVRANDANVYILRHCTAAPDGPWELVSFRKATK
jgi:hypothetical protein